MNRLTRWGGAVAVIGALTAGSGGGRVEGDAADTRAGARFFRVTSMTKVADRCAGEPAR
jgi:hypothetical protein